MWGSEAWLVVFCYSRWEYFSETVPIQPCFRWIGVHCTIVVICACDTTVSEVISQYLISSRHWSRDFGQLRLKAQSLGVSQVASDSFERNLALSHKHAAMRCIGLEAFIAERNFGAELLSPTKRWRQDVITEPNNLNRILWTVILFN